MAIAASLADADGAHDPQEEDVAMPEAAPDGAPTEAAQERTEPPPAEPRRCVVCLDDDAPVQHG